MNTTRLQEIESARQLGSYGWVGGLVVLVELRHRVASLREMLKLPPIEGFADLEEVMTHQLTFNIDISMLISISTPLSLSSSRRPLSLSNAPRWLSLLVQQNAQNL
jgi:hypothetical protein